jgi:lipooligosaccharide transport system permease protein
VVPLTLFSGSFFPITELPLTVRWLAWISPLWHGNELARGFALGTAELWPTVGHVAYLVALFAAGLVLARRLYHRRLIV